MKRIVGLYDSYQAADYTIEALIAANYDKNTIGVFTNETTIQEKTDTGTAATTAGVTVGGLAGLLVGLTAITVPGVGPVLAAGSLAALAGTTVLGAGAGGLIGALVDLGFSEEVAQTYIQKVKEGGLLVVVDADDTDEQNIRTIMEDNLASQIDVYDRP